MPGALFFVASWTAITGLFRWYVGHLGKFGVTYGTLGVVIVLLSWLYLTSLLLLLGAELNSALLSRAPADDVQSAGQSDGSRRPPPEESPDNI